LDHLRQHGFPRATARSDADWERRHRIEALLYAVPKHFSDRRLFDVLLTGIKDLPAIRRSLLSIVDPSEDSITKLSSYSLRDLGAKQVTELAQVIVAACREENAMRTHSGNALMRFGHAGALPYLRAALAEEKNSYLRSNLETAVRNLARK